jgi:hypothetical protein
MRDRAQFFKDLSMPFYGYNRDPSKASAMLASRLANNAQRIVYEVCSHGIRTTGKNRVCADPQVFIRGL